MNLTNTAFCTDATKTLSSTAVLIPPWHRSDSICGSRFGGRKQEEIRDHMDVPPVCSKTCLNSFTAGLTGKLCTVRIIFLSSATSRQPHHLPYRGLRNLESNMWTHFCIPFGTNFGSIFGSVFGSQFGGQELTSPIKRVHMSGLLGPVLCSILGPVLGPIFGSRFGPGLSILFDFFVHAPLSSQVAWLGQHSTNAARINSSSTLNTCIWHQLSMAVFSTTPEEHRCGPMKSLESGPSNRSQK